MKVALVIGHSKDKQGACNKTHNICEYKFNKRLTALVEDYIEENSDITIDRFYRKHGYSKLPFDLNVHNFDLVVAFHCNAYNKKASGTEVLFYKTSKKGKACAQLLNDSIVGLLQLNDRGIKGVDKDARGGYLLMHTSAPAIILEPFFIDNNEDLILALSNIEELAETIGSAIIKCEKIITED